LPVSAGVLVKVLAKATEYRLVCFKFGGEEEFFDGKGFGAFEYVAGIVLGPNPALLVDRTGGAGFYAVERAGFYGYEDLAKAWEWILREFHKLSEKEVNVLELRRDKYGEWYVNFKGGEMEK